MNIDLSQYNIFIAGGLGDIGKDLADCLKKSNAEVKIICSSNKFLNRFKIQSKKGGLEIIKTNYSSYKNLYEMFKNKCIRNKTNCLISLVGSGKIEGNYPYTEDEIHRIWNINYFANRNLVTAITEVLSENRNFNAKDKASHILTSSIASSKNVNAPIEYSSSKAALENFVKNLSCFISPNQRVNSVCPGHIYTPTGTWGIKSQENKAAVNDLIKKEIPTGRLGHIDDLTKLYLFLLCDSSSYITGTNIVIDGGISAYS